MTTRFTRSAIASALLVMSLAAAALLSVPANADPANADNAQAATAAATTSPPHAAAAPTTAAQAAGSAAGTDPSDTDASDSDDDSQNWDDNGNPWRRWGNQRRFRHHGDDLVSVGHDASLSAGTTRDSVVAVFGSATNDGTAREDVVSVFGDTTVNGQTAGSAVAVLGNVSVNADVGHDVVAVLGNVTLGPAAHVHGHVVSILGTVNRDPAAVVEQGVERVLPENFATAQSLRKWVGHGLMIGRPLVIGAGLQWLWGLSFAFLAVYTILALLFRDATEHCIATLHENPGKSLITAILAVMLTPLLLFLLAITVVGILVIPIALVTLFCAAVFGKTTVLGWIGNRCFSARPGLAAPHPALAVIVGGIIVMLAYLVPVLGFVVFILLGMLGYGAVLYALINRIRHTTSGGTVQGGAAPGGAAPGGPVPGASATDAGPVHASGADPAAAGFTTAADTTAAADFTSAASAADPAAADPAGHVAPAPLSTLPRASFWIRMGALLIDAIIVWAVVRLLLAWPHEGSTRLCLLALAVYGAVMWKFRSTTIGGIACNLRVVRLDSRPLDWPTVCVRALGCILSLLALGLGFFWIAFDPGRQAWHDKLAGTIVVRVPAGTPLV